MNLGSLGFRRLILLFYYYRIILDELHGAISCCFLAFSSKSPASSVVWLWSSRIVWWMKKLRLTFLQHEGDNDWMFNVGWTVPLTGSTEITELVFALRDSVSFHQVKHLTDDKAHSSRTCVCTVNSVAERGAGTASCQSSVTALRLRQLSNRRPIRSESLTEEKPVSSCYESRKHKKHVQNYTVVF